MNFSIGKMISNVKDAIGNILTGEIPVVDVYQREYSNPYCMNIVIPITSATQQVYTIPTQDNFKDKILIGIATRKQNASDNRYSKNGNKLINNDLIAAGFITLTQSNLVVHDDLPLENIVHEPSGQAGTYMQCLIEGQLTPVGSRIEFSIPPGATNKDRDVELIIFYVPKGLTCYK